MRGTGADRLGEPCLGRRDPALEFIEAVAIAGVLEA
jgi:hypothetical protein